MLTILCLLGCTTPDDEPAIEEPQPAPVPMAVPKHVSLFGVLPKEVAGEDAALPALVDLGRMLYFDSRLSPDADLSCDSCHVLAQYGVDGKATAGTSDEGHPPRNVPSTYNAVLQFRQHWDGEVDTLEAQARRALVDPHQMGMASESAVLGVLEDIPGYVAAFEAAFPGTRRPITFGHVGRALTTFESGLFTRGSKLDAYLKGDDEAMSREEIEGFDRFVDTGCVSCHSGVLLGGGMYQRLGSVHPYDTPDPGRAGASGEPTEDRVFKVPSLRNVTETGPWLHDGSVADLGEMVSKMSHHQLDRDLTESEVAAIVTFLATLKGELPTDYIASPTLPN